MVLKTHLEPFREPLKVPPTLLMWKSEKSLEISSDFDLTLIECSLAL